MCIFFFFFQAEDGIRDSSVTGVQTCALPISPLPVAATSTPTAAATGSGVTYPLRTLHFAVVVGPGGAEHCDIVGDMYAPSDASRTHRVPAILTTNGFGGSKDDQAGLARYFASQDYVVLSYSGLGFGGSGCK